MSDPLTVQAATLARPTWQRLRFWLALAALVVAGAIAVTVVSRAAGGSKPPLDPTSPAHNGSKALVQLLGQRGTTITRLTSPADAAARPSTDTVLVIDANDLSDDQLQALRGHRVVLINPDVTALAAFTSTYQSIDTADTDAIAPDCSWPGSLAGPVTFPEPTVNYSGPSTCYGGAVVVTDRLVVLGSGDLLRNDELAKNNIAALDINAISANGSATSVDWLMPSVEDAGSGSPSVWALFPPWAQRAFWWLLIVGVVTALWRGRRLGPVVTEPLPVVVRAAEVVEGHGRLYRRAAARARAGDLLRRATSTRLGTRLGLTRRATLTDVAGLLRPSAAAVLLGAPPPDDDALVALAHDLAALEAGSLPTVTGTDDRR